jgi:hypothetical protein
MREYELDELKWLLLKATRGPWQIVITRNVRDATSFMIREHSHPSVCVEADLFWPEDYEPLTDDDGYCQPDGHMDASPHHSANAVLIVSAVNALPALLDEVEGLRAERDALLNSIPIDLAKHVASLGPAEWGATAAMSADEHGKHVVQSVKITAERFGQTEDQQMHGLCLEGTDTVLCHTGTSPNSPQTSRALAGAWNKLVELCIARAALGETK